MTSAGTGKGADLGGLEGADAHCNHLRQGGGLRGGRNWKACLEHRPRRAATREWERAIASARARGATPRGWWWRRILGPALSEKAEANAEETALSERGKPIKGRGDKPDQHDILTGSD